MLIIDGAFIVGAPRDHHEGDQTQAVLDRQLVQGLAGLSAETVIRQSIAYELV